MGQRIEYWQNSELVRVDDTRDVAEERSRLVAEFRSLANVEILQRWPQYKQTNAAMGLLEADEVDVMKDGINAVRNKCNDLESQVAAAESLAQLDAIRW